MLARGGGRSGGLSAGAAREVAARGSSRSISSRSAPRTSTSIRSFGRPAARFIRMRSRTSPTRTRLVEVAGGTASRAPGGIRRLRIDLPGPLPLGQVRLDRHVEVQALAGSLEEARGGRARADLDLRVIEVLAVHASG